MNKSQLLNLNNNPNINDKPIFKVQKYDETTNYKTITNNFAQKDDSKEKNEEQFDVIESLLNEKTKGIENNSDAIENNIPNINTNNGNIPEQNDKIEDNAETKKKRRMYDFDEAKYCIFTSCKESIDFLLKEIFLLLNLIEFKLNCTLKDKLGGTELEQEKFFGKKIGDIYCDSTQKHTKDKIGDKKRKRGILKYILEQEEKDHTIKIKILKALFNMYYYDFLYAYIYDFTFIVFRNDINGETVVDFCQSIEEYSCMDCFIFNFITYKNCFIGKYEEEDKKKFKIKILEMISDYQMMVKKEEKKNN